MTVKELYDKLGEQIEQGHGTCIAAVADNNGDWGEAYELKVFIQESPFSYLPIGQKIVAIAT